MLNVYCVKLSQTVKIEPSHHFGGRETGWLYVVASSFESAIAAVQRKHPGTDIKGIDLMNYTGIPIVTGE